MAVPCWLRRGYTALASDKPRNKYRAWPGHQHDDQKYSCYRHLRRAESRQCQRNSCRACRRLRAICRDRRLATACRQACRHRRALARPKSSASNRRLVAHRHELKLASRCHGEKPAPAPQPAGHRRMAMARHRPMPYPRGPSEHIMCNSGHASCVHVVVSLAVLLPQRPSCRNLAARVERASASACARARRILRRPAE